ncbi:MAG: helix-turn-helix transcriptional regulator [Bdellovibrionales bacterium]|nr:helix-turn-helix transcriptional regulator [Bdellovibrionales bacterium]
MKKTKKILKIHVLKSSKAEEMKANVLSANCPSRRIMNNVTSKWSVLVFLVLSDGSVKRFSELRRQIEGVSEKMLTQTLRSLEVDQFIIRKSYHVVPPYVEYSLSKLGLEAAKKVISLTGWIEANLEQIDAKK